MNFSVTGTVFQSLRNTQLQVKWQQRRESLRNSEEGLRVSKENVFIPEGEEDPERVRLYEDAASVRESSANASLDGKLRAGAELTEDELRYLKECRPALYREAVALREERQAYKKQLAACKTKEDAEKLHSEKMQRFVMEADAVQKNPNIPREQKRGLMERILARMLTIEREQTRFVQSGRFSALPREEERDGEDARREPRTEEEAAQGETSPAAAIDSVRGQLESLEAWGDGGAPRTREAPRAQDAAVPGRTRGYRARA